jgi:hypothetical protein
MRRSAVHSWHKIPLPPCLLLFLPFPRSLLPSGAQRCADGRYLPPHPLIPTACTMTASGGKRRPLSAGPLASLRHERSFAVPASNGSVRPRAALEDSFRAAVLADIPLARSAWHTGPRADTGGRSGTCRTRRGRWHGVFSCRGRDAGDFRSGRVISGSRPIRLTLHEKSGLG